MSPGGGGPRMAMHALTQSLMDELGQVDSEDVRVFLPGHDEMDWDRARDARRYQEAVAQLRADVGGDLCEWWN